MLLRIADETRRTEECGFMPIFDSLEFRSAKSGGGRSVPADR